MSSRLLGGRNNRGCCCIVVSTDFRDIIQRARYGESSLAYKAGSITVRDAQSVIRKLHSSDSIELIRTFG